MEIIYRNKTIVAATLTAGSVASVTAMNPPEGAVLHLCITDGSTGRVLAVSEELNKDNEYAGVVDLNTDVVYDLFRDKDTSARTWIEMELLDFDRRVSLALGHGAMRNSTLLTGTSSAIPDVDTLISRSDFAEFDGSRPATVSQAYDQIARLIQILKGDKR